METGGTSLATAGGAVPYMPGLGSSFDQLFAYRSCEVGLCPLKARLCELGQGMAHGMKFSAV